MRDGCLDDSSNGYVWVSCWVSEYITMVAVVSKLVYFFFTYLQDAKNNLPYLGVLWSYKSTFTSSTSHRHPRIPQRYLLHNDEAKPPTKVQ